MVYEGNDNYIFVSYAHKDAQQVLPIVHALDAQGFRVWYDAGIEAGTEWPEYIEEHLKNAAVVLVFMTPNTINSKNCRNEINFALELDKEMLIAYLEETTLVKGMRLQLNSTQSLFKRNYFSDEVFINELLGARILQSCRKGGTAKPVQRVVQPQVSQTRVSNVCSIGTNDKNDLWPKGLYSQTINRDKHNVVFFHISLLKTFGFAGTITNKYQIYNSNNNLVFDDVSNIDIQPEHDKISMGWILKGKDGSFVPSGKYRLVCSINNSPPFTYFFTVTSDQEAKPAASQQGSVFGFIKKMFDL